MGRFGCPLATTEPPSDAPAPANLPAIAASCEDAFGEGGRARFCLSRPLTHSDVELKYPPHPLAALHPQRATSFDQLKKAHNNHESSSTPLLRRWLAYLCILSAWAGRVEVASLSRAGVFCRKPGKRLEFEILKRWHQERAREDVENSR